MATSAFEGYDMNLTPNKRRREGTAPNYDSNKENKYFCNSYMEVKSLSDMIVENPYEIIRGKPPKKKKKHDIEESCFVNPALNINGPENIINPFEIKRTVPVAATASPNQHCFVNTGLNIRAPERENDSRNPFEIVRTNINTGK